MTGYDARAGVANLAARIDALALLLGVPIPESQVTSLVTDLAGKAQVGVLAGCYDVGTATIPSGRFLAQYKRLTLSGAERLAAQGTTNVLVQDLGTTGARVIGSPKTIDGPFILPNETFFVQRKRLTLCTTGRGALLGTANLMISDDFGERSRIALTGRG